MRALPEWRPAYQAACVDSALSVCGALAGFLSPATLSAHAMRVLPTRIFLALLFCARLLTLADPHQCHVALLEALNTASTLYPESPGQCFDRWLPQRMLWTNS